MGKERWSVAAARVALKESMKLGLEMKISSVSKDHDKIPRNSKHETETSKLFSRVQPIQQLVSYSTSSCMLSCSISDSRTHVLRDSSTLRMVNCFIKLKSFSKHHQWWAGTKDLRDTLLRHLMNSEQGLYSGPGTQFRHLEDLWEMRPSLGGLSVSLLLCF